MPESIAYTAVATSDGDGRNGHVRSNDGLIDADVRTPKEMGGAGGATNPEQLFAAGYAACFHSALKASSKVHGVQIVDSAVTAESVIVTPWTLLEALSAEWKHAA